MHACTAVARGHARGHISMPERITWRQTVQFVSSRRTVSVSVNTFEWLHKPTNNLRIAHVLLTTRCQGAAGRLIIQVHTCTALTRTYSFASREAECLSGNLELTEGFLQNIFLQIIFIFFRLGYFFWSWIVAAIERKTINFDFYFADSVPHVRHTAPLMRVVFQLSCLVILAGF